MSTDCHGTSGALGRIQRRAQRAALRQKPQSPSISSIESIAGFIYPVCGHWGVNDIHGIRPLEWGCGPGEGLALIECLGCLRGLREWGDEMDLARSLPEQSGDELTARDQQILDFERQWWKYSGAKEQAIRDLFDLSPTRYYRSSTTSLIPRRP